jgi:hypothetical protein
MPYDTSESLVESSKDSNVSSLMVLTKRNLKDQHGQANYEQCHQIGDEKRTASIVFGEGRESPDVSETDGTADGRKIKGSTRWPAIAILRAIVRSLSTKSNVTLGLFSCNGIKHLGEEDS